VTQRFNPLLTARILVILALVTLMRSPALVNLFLALLLLLTLGSASIRQRLALTWAQPMVKGSALLLALLGAGILYSASGWRDGLNQLWAWRTLGFMAIAAALFDDVRWKRIALRAFAGVTALGALAVVLMSIQQTWASGQHNPVPVTLFRNYATQGMTFTAALVACGLLWWVESGRWRQLWCASALVLLVATTVVTEGRSGYLVLLAAAAVFVLGSLLQMGLSLTRALAGALAIAGLGLALVTASPVARQRIDLALTEMRNFESQGNQVTSMGLRMYFWRDAVTLTSERPIFGWGTGSYAKAQGQLVAGRTGAAAMPTTDPHNQFLKIAAENGLVGLGVFLVFLISLLRQRPSPSYRLAGLSVLAGWCATSLASSHFSTFQEGHLLALYLGITLAAESATHGNTD
jgi:O-antigen ligase